MREEEEGVFTSSFFLQEEVLMSRFAGEIVFPIFPEEGAFQILFREFPPSPLRDNTFTSSSAENGAF